MFRRKNKSLNIASGLVAKLVASPKRHHYLIVNDPEVIATHSKTLQEAMRMMGITFTGKTNHLRLTGVQQAKGANVGAVIHLVTEDQYRERSKTTRDSATKHYIG